MCTFDADVRVHAVSRLRGMQEVVLVYGTARRSVCGEIESVAKVREERSKSCRGPVLLICQGDRCLNEEATLEKLLCKFLDNQERKSSVTRVRECEHIYNL